MKLGEWLDREALKPADFAARIERTSEAVRRYVAGERIPDRDTMPLIVEKTRGEVTPNDFFDFTAPNNPPPFLDQPHRTDDPAPRASTTQASKTATQIDKVDRIGLPSRTGSSTRRPTSSATSEEARKVAA